jgi:hypothetical protein
MSNLVKKQVITSWLKKLSKKIECLLDSRYAMRHKLNPAIMMEEKELLNQEDHFETHNMFEGILMGQ